MFCAKNRTFMDCNFDMLTKYLRGDATQDERLRVMEWVKESDDNRKELQAFRRIYDALLISDEAFTVRTHRGIRRLFVKIGAVAAAAAVVAGIFFMTGRNTDRQEPEILAAASISAPLGYQTVTVLSDGTRIRLNSGSDMEILPGNGTERRVRLRGEAYFEVAHDEARPFVLETSGMEVKVLGTTFNVTAYDEIQSVVLVEGSVEVKGSAEEKSTRIEPSQKYEYNALSGASGVEVIDTEEYTDWTEGYILLKDTPMSEILERLGNYFGVGMEIAGNDFADVKVDGKLMLDGGLGTALETLSLIVPMQYEGLGSGTITVEPRH